MKSLQKRSDQHLVRTYSDVKTVEQLVSSCDTAFFFFTNIHYAKALTNL